MPIQKAQEDEENEEATPNEEEVQLIPDPPHNTNLVMAEAEVLVALKLRCINSSPKRRIHSNITNKQDLTRKTMIWKKRKLANASEFPAVIKIIKVIGT